MASLSRCLQRLRPSYSELHSNYLGTCGGHHISLQKRHASHSSQGVANRAKQGYGKRLGAKKGDSELVIPGNIIFRQRGSLWHPGENCVMGRDHTISTLVKGYVRYYRDPRQHKTRKYIGVVFDQKDRLPRHPSAPRSRRLGLDIQPMREEQVDHSAADPDESLRTALKYGVGRRLVVNKEPDTAVRDGYQFRETYRSIGRTAEREGLLKGIARDGKGKNKKWAKRAWERIKYE